MPVVPLLLAIGAIMAAKDHDVRIPDELSVVGFGDLDISRLITPPLTTVHESPAQVGERAAGILVDIMEKRLTTPVRVLLEGELVIRDSTRTLAVK